MTSGDLGDQLKRLVTEQAPGLLEKNWDEFCDHVRGKPEDEIRAEGRNWFEPGELDDDVVAALSRGEKVEATVRVEP